MSALFVIALLAADAGFVFEPPPHVVSDVPVQGELNVNGVPVRLRKLTVKLPAHEVGRHFYESFARQGLWVPPGMPYDRVVTGVRPSDLHTFSALIQPIDARHCGVVLGEAVPTAAARGAEPTDPLFPGASRRLVTRFESGHTVSYRARATEAELGAFYARVLGAAGFTRGPQGEWKSASEEVSVFSMSDAGDATMSKVVLIRRLRAAAVEEVPP